MWDHRVHVTCDISHVTYHRAHTVVSTVVEELLHVEMNDVGAHVVKEILVVRDDQKGLFPLGEVAVEPDHSVEVLETTWGEKSEKQGIKN